MYGRRFRLVFGVLAFALLAGCNVRPLMPFLPKSPPERLRSNPVVLDKSCTSCHTIGTNGGTVGPVLNQVANRRTTDWLRTWLRDPSAVKPGTKMPNFELSNREIETVVTDLSRMRRDINAKEILARAPSPDEAGRQLFEAYDCYACHRIGSRGGYNAPDLTWVGRWQSTEWEGGWLRDPAGHRPGTFMPDFHLQPDEITALTAFLGTLKGGQHAEDQRWTQPAYRKKALVRGELVFEKLGCRGCHGEHGTAGGFRNPNAAPDEMVPPLTTASEKYDETGLKRRLAVAHRPAKLDPWGPEPPLACPVWQDVLAEGEVSDLVVYVVSLGPKKSKWTFK